MSNFDKELEEILLSHAFHYEDGERNGNDIESGIKSIKQVVDKYVIGEGELHVSHVCPPDSIGCAKFAARGLMRNDQRQSLWGISK